MRRTTTKSIRTAPLGCRTSWMPATSRQVSSTHGVLKMSDPTNSPDTHSVTSLPASAAGPTPWTLPDGRVIERSGQGHVHVNHLAPLEKVMEQQTPATCGRISSGSSKPVVPVSYSASKLRVLTSSDGRRERRITCRICNVEKICEEYRTAGPRQKFRGTCRDCQNEQERKRRFRKCYLTADQRKKWRLNNRGSALVSSARCRARARSLDFDLDAKAIQARIDSGFCELTGMPFDLKDKQNSPSLDRKDPNKGYTMDNTRVVLTCVNLMLNTWGVEKILQIADALRSNR